MYGMRVRRSGSMRGAWHKREKKRLSAELRPVTPPMRVRTRAVPTEAQWLSGDPGAMIGCVVRLATDPRIVFHMTAPQVARKLRLFYCACARLRWALLPYDVRQLVDVIERCANGLGNGRALRDARRAARAAHLAARPAWTPAGYAEAAWERSGAVGLVVDAVGVSTQLQRWGGWVGSRPDAAEQVEILRDLLDNPFRPTEVDWRWATSDVVRLARHIRTERDYELMPYLGDALQDAGCASAAVLAHCYEPQRHVRGCWLVDALTG